MIKLQGAAKAGDYRASTLAANYEIEVNLARDLKAGRIISVDPETAARLKADAIAVDADQEVN